MNLQKLKQKLMPELKKITLSIGDDVYIHRPTMANLEKCDSAKTTLLYTVSDEQGKPIFSTEESDDKININEVDSTYVNEIYNEVLSLYKSDESTVLDEVEKK